MQWLVSNSSSLLLLLDAGIGLSYSRCLSKRSWLVFTLAVSAERYCHKLACGRVAAVQALDRNGPLHGREVPLQGENVVPPARFNKAKTVEHPAPRVCTTVW